MSYPVKAQGEDLPEIHFRDLIEAMPSGLLLLNAAGEISYASPAFLRMMGFVQRGDFVGRNALDFVVAEDRERAARKLMERFEGKIGGTGIYRVQRKDGLIIHVEVNAAPRVEAKGGQRGLLAIARDVTARVEALRALEEHAASLRASEERQRRILENMPIMLAAVDYRGNVLAWNQESARVTGYSASEVLGHAGIWEWIYPDPAYRAELNRAMRLTDDPVYEIEIPMESRHGRRWVHWFHMSARLPLEGWNFWAVGVDVTERRQALEELAAARDQAEKAGQAKGDFLALMSHEIRTPLNALLGCTELLLHDEEDVRKKELLEAVHGSGASLSVLLNDILDFSRLEVGRLQIHKEMFEPCKLARQVIETFLPKARRKKVELRLDCTTCLHCEVQSDPHRVRQIINNLVDNALKFTHEGSVVVKVEQRPTGASEDFNWLICTVTDSGPGIPPSDRDRVFEPFTQLDASTARAVGGSGLGLAISRSLARLLGGDLRLLSSRHDVGSAFELSIPCDLRPAVIPTQPEDTQPSTAEPHALARLLPLHILILDDARHNLLVLSQMLQAFGYSPIVAETADEATQILQETPCDLVFTDIILPGEDGFALCRAWRKGGLAAPQYAKPVQIIAVSGDPSVLEPDGLKAAGFDDFLFKPVSLDSLHTAILAAGQRLRAH